MYDLLHLKKIDLKIQFGTNKNIEIEIEKRHFVVFFY